MTSEHVMVPEGSDRPKRFSACRHSDHARSAAFVVSERETEEKKRRREEQERDAHAILSSRIAGDSSTTQSLYCTIAVVYLIFLNGRVFISICLSSSSLTNRSFVSKYSPRDL